MALSHKELLRRAEANEVLRIPIFKTLNRYGLTEYEWLSMLNAQGWACGCCGKKKQLWNIDHHHVRGWNKMPRKERKKYVRGILCWRCNKIVVASRLTAEESARITTYLKKYEARRRAAEAKYDPKGDRILNPETGEPYKVRREK
jgi:hypothetical protein